MDSKQDVQVGVFRQYPRIGSLSLWERARVRGSSVTHKKARRQSLVCGLLHIRPGT
jgi:hypothetical protein